MIQLNKAQAATALGISLRTLATRMKLGTVKYSKIEGAKPFEQSVTFTYQQLGIPEPVEAAPVVHDVQIAPQYNEPKPERFVFVPRQPTREELDEEFSEAYREGRATDSMGNRIDGTNVKFPTLGTQSLLGPVEVDHGPPVETQSHMQPAMLSTNDHFGNPIAVVEAPTLGYTRGGCALAPGVSPEQYDSMMKDWNRRGGGASEADQELASRRAAQNIRNSFPRG